MCVHMSFQIINETIEQDCTWSERERTPYLNFRLKLHYRNV